MASCPGPGALSLSPLLTPLSSLLSTFSFPAPPSPSFFCLSIYLLISISASSLLSYFFLLIFFSVSSLLNPLSLLVFISFPPMITHVSRDVLSPPGQNHVGVS